MTENPQKKSIPFIDILKQAARIVWQNRFLLWFGLLMALGSPGSFNIGGNKDWEKQGEPVKNFFEAHWQFVLAIAVLLFAVGIILFLISLVAKAGLIRSVRDITQNKKTAFRVGWKAGKKYLGKLLGLSLLFFGVTFVVIVVLAVPVVFLAVAKSWIAAVLVGLLAIAIFIPLIFILALTKAFAEFYIVLPDLRIRGSVEAGYELLLKNLGNSIIFALLLFAVGLAAGIILLPVAAVSLAILVPAGIIFFYLNKIVFAVFLTFAILMFLAVILFAASIFQAYKTTAWTLFFQEIARVEKPEPEKAAEEAIEKSIAPTPASPG